MPDADDSSPPRPADKTSASSIGNGGWGNAAAYAGLGVQFVLAILFFLYAGRWLDRRLGTQPVFLYVGVFAGAGAGFYLMYRRLMRDQRREDESRRA
jgi:ATP synthase protein I